MIVGYENMMLILRISAMSKKILGRNKLYPYRNY